MGYGVMAFGVDPGGAWMPIRIDFIGQVQRALVDAGVPEDRLSVGDTVFGGPPVPLPAIDDFPGIGVTPPDRVVDARAALAAADPNRVTDADVRAAVDELGSWLSTCAGRGHQLVCFYH